MIFCSICYNDHVDPDFICDTCEENYCEDCSYTFSLHYQFQGSRCYICADQHRRTKLSKVEKRDRKLNYIEYVGNNS